MKEVERSSVSVARSRNLRSKSSVYFHPLTSFLLHSRSHASRISKFPCPSDFIDKICQGDRIALLAVPGCGDDGCPECSRDLAQLCQRGHHSGIGQDGFYAPFAAISARGAVRLPEGMVHQSHGKMVMQCRAE
jgi:hypothetical protein